MSFDLACSKIGCPSVTMTKTGRIIAVFSACSALAPSAQDRKGQAKAILEVIKKTVSPGDNLLKELQKQAGIISASPDAEPEHEEELNADVKSVVSVPAPSDP